MSIGCVMSMRLLLAITLLHCTLPRMFSVTTRFTLASSIAMQAISLLWQIGLVHPLPAQVAQIPPTVRPRRTAMESPAPCWTGLQEYRMSDVLREPGRLPRSRAFPAHSFRVTPARECHNQVAGLLEQRKFLTV